MQEDRNTFIGKVIDEEGNLEQAFHDNLEKAKRVADACFSIFQKKSAEVSSFEQILSDSRGALVDWIVKNTPLVYGPLILPEALNYFENLLQQDSLENKSDDGQNQVIATKDLTYEQIAAQTSGEYTDKEVAFLEALSDYYSIVIDILVSLAASGDANLIVEDESGTNRSNLQVVKARILAAVDVEQNITHDQKEDLKEKVTAFFDQYWGVVKKSHTGEKDNSKISNLDLVFKMIDRLHSDREKSNVKKIVRKLEADKNPFLGKQEANTSDDPSSSDDSQATG